MAEHEKPARKGDKTRPVGDEPPRRSGGKPQFGGKPQSGGRPSDKPPYKSRPSGDRPPSDGGQSGERPRGAKPYGAKPYGAKPYGAKPYGAKPYGSRPRSGPPPGNGGRGGPPQGQPYRGSRPPGDRPPSYGSRPPGDRPPSYGSRPPGGRSLGDGPSGYRPRPPSFDRRPSGYGPRAPQRYGAPGAPNRPAYTPRPQRESTEGLLGEDEELIGGKRPVEEAFAARREAVRLLVVPERRAALEQLVIHATTLRIPVVELEGGSLTSLAGFDGHQGIALVAKPRPAADVETILALAHQRNEAPFVLVLDSLEDPHNFGALLRSAEACGVHGVVYPTRHAAPLSPSAIKSSAGATEHLLLAPVEDLAGTLVDLHGRGLRIAGAEQDAPLSYSEADMRGPLAIVVGSEGKGISGPVRRRLDLAVGIPMRGRIASLNAAVAGSILLFAAAAQRPSNSTAAPVPEADAAPKADAAPELNAAPDSETAPIEPPADKPKARRRTKSTQPDAPPPAAADSVAEQEELLPSEG